MADRFFDKVYGVSTPAETRALYDRFSAEYDAEVAAQGYATPGRLARALAGISPDLSAPVLDFGCGTGLSGLALTAAGFTVLDGMDLSADMLAQARRRGLYRDLTHIEADTDLGPRRGDWSAVVACGVIGSGAAPVTVLGTLIALLAPGGLFAFSFNDHTLEDPAYEAALTRAVDVGLVRSRFSEYGPHLPGLDLNSVIHVVEKL